jgi:hypothetical protein
MLQRYATDVGAPGICALTFAEPASSSAGQLAASWSGPNCSWDPRRARRPNHALSNAYLNVPQPKKRGSAVDWLRFC